jgi:hypothetical protein
MDPIEFPENFSELTDEQLTELSTSARAALSSLLENEAPTVADATEAERLSRGITSVDGEVTARAEAVTRFNSIRESFTAEPVVEETPAEAAPVEETPAATEAAPVEAAAETVETPPAEVVEATVDTAALAGQRPNIPLTVTERKPRLTAAADVRGHGTGADMSYDQVAEALLDKYRSFPQPAGRNERFGGDVRVFGLAQLEKEIPEELQINDRMGPQQIEAVLQRAIDQTRLPKGNLVAAGGWCSPSETAYNLSDTGETTVGMISLPEVGMGRGGIRRTLGPDFADIYALDNFFKMTEAQAIAGSFEKPCFTVTCPTFEDFRLDAYGYCFQIPFLTEAAYPEVIKRYLSGSLVAYAHKMNADKISRVLTGLGAAETANDLASTAPSTFGAIQFILDRERTKRRWSFTQAVEIKLPMWVRGALRLELSNRTGQPFQLVTDAQISSLFSSLNASVEWLYDWAGQDLDDEATDYPSDFDMMIYKAGTFVVGTTSVVNLSSVYDAASLKENIYTGAFFEEGMTLVRMSYGGNLVTVPICNSSKSGAANLDYCAAP